MTTNEQNGSMMITRENYQDFVRNIIKEGNIQFNGIERIETKQHTFFTQLQKERLLEKLLAPDMQAL